MHYTRPPGGSWSPPTGFFDKLTTASNGNSATLTTADQTRYEFSRLGGSEVLYLTAVKDRMGNTVTVNRAVNDPVGFADPAGLYRQGYDAVSDFMAGWGDALTPPGPIGLIIGPDPYTKRFREFFGYDGNVEYDDGWYGGGWWTGFANELLLGGGGSKLGKIPIGRAPKAVPDVPIKG